MYLIMKNINHYKKTPLKNKWTETRKLSEEAFRIWNKNKTDRPNNSGIGHVRTFLETDKYASIKNKILRHNQLVRRSWTLGTFNRRESVLEMYVNLKDNAIKTQLVDKDGSVRPVSYYNAPRDVGTYNEDDFLKIMGDSELPVQQLDHFDLAMGLLDYAAYITCI